MTARVLVVDDILANVKLLEARLTAEYFEVVPAFSGREALGICQTDRIDIVLLDVMMPGMDGFEACRLIKANPKTQHLPIVMVTALDQLSDRVQGLEAGADDFLTKPVDEIALITRVKNLARLKVLNDEMLMRLATSQTLGLPIDSELERALAGRSGRILLVEDHQRSAARIVEALAKSHDVTVESEIGNALNRLVESSFDVAIVSLGLVNADGLRLCSQIRSLERIRHLPIIILVDPGEEARLLRGLDMGVNDYLMRPLSPYEMLARVRTQIRRKRYADFLRNRIDKSVELSVTDALTGLYNRRYMEGHLNTLVAECAANARQLSMLVVDLDFFKNINDTHGHDAGDAVLREVASRMRDNTRGIDLVCRFGGEEFIVIMPDTDHVRAYQVGERIRACIAATGFSVDPSVKIKVTASIGIATMLASGDSPETLLKRADTALYSAKHHGRNQVATNAA